METETAVRKKSLYTVVNEFLTGQWIGQIVVSMVSSFLVSSIVWAWRCWNFKSKGGLELEIERLRQLMEQRLDRQASRIEEELKILKLQAAAKPGELEDVCRIGMLTPRPANISVDCNGEITQIDVGAAINGVSKKSTTASMVGDIDIMVVIDKDLSAPELQHVWSAMPSEQVTGISGSHVFQTSISFEDGQLVQGLRRLLQNLAPVNLSESCRIQLGHWGVFDQGQNRLERFMEENLPTLLMCTRITFDKISICGLHLKVEGPVSIYAATAERKHALDVTWDKDEIVPGVERGVASLPYEFTDIAIDVWIYATKTVPTGEAGYPTIFRSHAIPLRNIENVAPLNWPSRMDAVIGSILLLGYVLAFFNGLLQALVVASVWFTTWGLFQLAQRQLTRRRFQSTNPPWQVLIRVASTICKLGLLPFELLKNISWGRESSSRRQRDRSINSDTPLIIQTEDQASFTQATHETSQDVHKARTMTQHMMKIMHGYDTDDLEKLNTDANKTELQERPFQESDLEAPDWKWPRYETLVRKGVKVKRRVVEHNQNSGARPPFIVTQHHHEDGYMIVVVTLYSSWLIEIVKKLIPGTEADTHDEPEINGQTLFHARNEMEKFLGAATWKYQLHLRHLVRFVKEEYKNTSFKLQQALEQKSITWEILWTVLVPGEVVSYQCELTTQHVSGTILQVKQKIRKKQKFWRIFIGVRDFDLQSYKECSVSRDIMEYTDKQPFSSLDVVPLKHLHEADRNQREERFLRQGEMFYRLMLEAAGQPLYMEYKGSIATKRWEAGCWIIEKSPGDGRVMVDLRSFARMNPGFPMGNARPPCDLLRGAATCPKVPRPHSQQLKRSPAFVYGFSFSYKQWGCFDVCGFSNVVFSNKPFEELVMENRKKAMLLTMATNCTLNRGVQVDSIANKGSGCIILCYGPPGSGKTLTAELLAEALHRPLYSVNAFELPSTDKRNSLETRLLNIFELSYTWRAILLLDEADVYMEKRSSTSSPHTNASTGIFLRQLEYFSGIMFLTTNRPKCFDAAFRSRISVSIYYPPLDQQQRAQIWRQMLNKAGLQDGDIDFLKLASHPFHGREIRNIISVAKLWGGKSWSTDHITQVIEMRLSEDQLLNQIEDTT